ncbi:MAG: hypothetical protein ACYCO9_07255 [Streptosporangiaceae bacterium]
MSFPAREPPSPVASSGSRARRGLALRIVAHFAVWLVFADAAVRAVRGGWRPVSDAAVIAIRSWDVLTAHGLLVGEATRLAHGVYDLGPAEFWLLALPVRIDPADGVLWGAALWCMVAGSLAIEASRAVAGRIGVLVASGMILGIVAWSPKAAMLPYWNPWFGMMFFLAALAAGWAVLSGRSAWWPVLAVTGSVAAQAHLMYALAAACLLMIGFVAVVADSRGSGRYRWAVAGTVAGLACWLAPLIQQFTVRSGNISRLLGVLRAGGTAGAGLGFGLRALAAGSQPPAYWWMPSIEALRLGDIEYRPAWFGVAQLIALVMLLLVAVLVLRSRRAAALVGLSLVTALSVVETFAGIPAWNIIRPVTDLSYLLAPLFPMGALFWLSALYVVALMVARVSGWATARSGPHRAVISAGKPGGSARSRLPRLAGPISVVLAASLGVWAAAHVGGALTNQRPARRAIVSAAGAITRRLPAQQVALTVVAPSKMYGRQVILGLAYLLRSDGFAPEITPSLAFQIAPAYYYRGSPITRVTVVIHRGGGHTRVIITGG